MLQSQSRGLNGMTMSQRDAIVAGHLTQQARDGRGGPRDVAVASNSALSNSSRTKLVDASFGARDGRQSRDARD